ncbi:hypothetical protein HU724_010385 [Pseudomonas iranensis]|uniref:hypothetical protein n=1 Tax=Pseudomonas iranensis TaxID=2745503 RepID=UPI0016493870|nr:hypothetical protein [Pseudomonas iranensis]QXI24656.1 hypothetical protein HU724_010385 [Pseudomonas iranensis]
MAKQEFIDSINPAEAKKVGRIDAVLRSGIAILVIALVISGIFYFWVFRYGLSSNPDNWSAFGSFFGGIFGPLISAVTLVALLKTISLQREVIDTQREEYRKLQKQQEFSLSEQQQQTELARMALMSARVADYRAGILQMLEQQCNYQHSAANAYSGRINTSLSMLGPLAKMEDSPENIKAVSDLKVLAERMGESEKSAQEISKLSMRLAIKEFETVDELKSYIEVHISKIVSQRELTK